jgi:catechol 2,3-dioxygenase-like lactoylglutathione lyase family enzyme
MFDHVTIRGADRAASESFYSTVLPALAIDQTHSGEWYAEWNRFFLAPATAEQPPTRRLHIGFAAPTQAHVDEFWRLGSEAGYRSDGPPGLRPEYGPDYYGSFLLDPDGNSAEAVHFDTVRRGGNVDHLWIRVRDVKAARRFYELVAPHAGFRLDPRPSDRAQFVPVAGEGGSFSLVAGEPTENLHVAFPVADNATVEAFHRATTQAGYRDDGAPGEREIYHPGYFGAFVLDPDGNSVELVNHNR